MMEIEKSLRQAFGDELINIVNEWSQLSSEDIREIYEKEITRVYAVYNSWEDVTREHLNRGDCDKYIIPFVDLKALTAYIAETEKDEWIELKSGKLLKID